MGIETTPPGAKSIAIGERIKQARKELGMSQEELGELLRVSPRSMQGYESGEVVPYKRLRELENILGRPASWILHGEPPQLSPDSEHALAAAISRVELKVDRLLDALRSISHELG